MYFKPDVLKEQVHSHKSNWRSPKGTACVEGVNLGANSNFDIATNTCFSLF